MSGWSSTSGGPTPPRWCHTFSCAALQGGGRGPSRCSLLVRLGPCPRAWAEAACEVFGPPKAPLWCHRRPVPVVVFRHALGEHHPHPDGQRPLGRISVEGVQALDATRGRHVAAHLRLLAAKGASRQLRRGDSRENRVTASCGCIIAVQQMTQ
eukprot:scaffold4342_cov234-Pinguiococcus_pyrenoidosus.AAC.2